MGPWISPAQAKKYGYTIAQEEHGSSMNRRGKVLVDISVTSSFHFLKEA